MQKMTPSQLKKWLAIIVCLLLLGFIFGDKLYKGYVISFPIASGTFPINASGTK